MAMKKKFRAVVSTGTYVDRRTNETKRRYQTIGTVFVRTEEKTLSMKLEALPISKDWDGWINFYPFEEKNGGSRPQRRAAPPPEEQGDFDDDIPF